MNNLKKRCLTLLLSLAMIVTYMPINMIAYAVDDNEQAQVEQQAEPTEEVAAEEAASEETPTDAAAEEAISEDEVSEEAASEAAKPEKAAPKETASSEKDEPAKEEKPAEEATTSTEAEQPKVELLNRTTTLTAEGNGYTVSAVVGKDAKVPADTELQVSELGKNTDKYDQYYDEALKALQDDSNAVQGMKSIKLYDISLESDSQDDSVQPDAAVSVKIEYDKGIKVDDEEEAKQNIRIVHFGDKDTTVLDNDKDNVEATVEKSKMTEASFDTDGFSVFAVVIIENEEGTLTVNQDGYEITINYTKEANIPVGTELVVKEITPDQDEYQKLRKQTIEKMNEGVERENEDQPDPRKGLSDIAFFDISLHYNGKEIEPAVPLDVHISSDNGMFLLPEGEKPVVVHFADKEIEFIDKVDVETVEANDINSVLPAGEVATDCSYTQDSFSVVGVGSTGEYVEIKNVGNQSLRALRAAGSEIAASKEITENGNGTYNIALNVTGSSESSSSTTVTKSNVVIVVDVSGSMDEKTYSVVETGSSGVTYYDEDGNNVYWRDGKWQKYSRRYGYYDFDGTVYEDNGTRLANTKAALKTLVEALLKNNEKAPDAMEISLIKFANKTSNSYQGYNGTSVLVSKSTSQSAINSQIDGLTAGGGTNWEAALSAANTEAAKYEQDQTTSIIFVTDGMPTLYGSDSGTGQEGSSNVQSCWGEAKDDARGLIEKNGQRTNYDFYSIFAYGEGSDYLKALTNYAYTGSGSYDSTDTKTYADGTKTTDHFFEAKDTSALSKALESILDHISKSAGFGGVTVDDGVSLGVTNTSVTVDGSVNTSSFKYTVKEGSNEVYTVKINGNQATFTIGGQEYKATGKSETVTINGTTHTNTVYSVTVGDKTYKMSPATMDDKGEVKWDLACLGTLENGYTYTLSFDVWPNQEAFDTVADLNNGLTTIDKVPKEIKDYLVEKDGKYYVRTNYQEYVDYYTVNTEQKEGEDPVTTYTEQPRKELGPKDPVALTSSTMAMKKLWDDSLDESQLNELLYNEDETPTEYGVKLHVWKADTIANLNKQIADHSGTAADASANDYLEKSLGWNGTEYEWEDTLDVAPGTMISKSKAEEMGIDISKHQVVSYNGKDYVVLESGHYYTVTEDDIDYHFELNTIIYHPMLVDGVLSNVTFKEDGTTVEKIEAMSTVDATNTLKGGINITKKTVDSKGKEIQFKEEPFEITVNVTDADGNALPTKRTSDGTEYTIDYRIYYGPNNPNYDAASGGGRSGHIYKTGTQFTESIYAGDTIRVVNVENGALFSVEEDTTKLGDFTYDSTEYQIKTGTGDAADYADSDIVTKDGKDWYPVKGNSASYAEVTNKLKDGLTVELNGTKTWNDNDASTRPEKIVINLIAEAAGTTYQLADDVVKKLEVTKAEDGSWTYSFKNLPKYTEDGALITYSIVEEAVANYSTTYGEVKRDKNTGNFTADVTNTNTTIDASAEAFFKKTVTKANTVKAATFGFTLTEVDANGNAISGGLTKTGTAEFAKGETGSKAISGFGKITYTEPGKHYYKIEETSKPDGWTSTPNNGQVTVTVVVSKAQDGKLSATVDGKEISNAYSTTDVEVDPTKADFANKKVTAANKVKDYTFNFEMIEVDKDGKALDGAVAETKSVEYKAGEDGAKKIGFNKITYSTTGTHYYKITETNADQDGWKATNNNAIVTVKVTDNGKGALEAEVTSATIENAYGVTPKTASFPVKKELSVPEGLKGPAKWSYDITVEPQNNAPTAAKMTGTVDQDSEIITFGPFTYTAIGEYKYKVTESGTVAGVDNDSEAATGKIVTVTVKDNGDGTLTATADSTEASPLTFTNTYSVKKTTASFPVEKELSVPEGLEGPAEWSYTIDVAANDGAPEAETMTGTVDQDKTSETFGPFTYTEPGTYTYTVSETGEVKGVTNDAEAAGKTVTVSVVDNGNGTLTATADSTTDEPLTFTNTYSVEETTASFPVKKELSVPEGMDGPADWSYTIDVTAEDDAPEADTMTGTVTKAAPTADFGPFTYTEPGTYTYTVSETGEVKGVTNDAEAAGKTVTVTVEDNGDGTLTATASSTEESPLTFYNSYSVGSTTAYFPVEKELSIPEGLEGPAKWSYTINVAANGNAPEADTMTGTVDQDKVSETFGPFTFTEPGKYTYTVSETGTVKGVENDKEAAGKTVTVNVVDNGDGTLTATADSTDNKPLTFTNTYSVEETTASFPVEKIMSVPAGLDGPEKWSYTIDVAASEGAPAAATMTGTVDQDNKSVTFGPITYTTPGTYTYTVSETGEIDGVTNDADAAGKTVTVTVLDNGDGTLTATPSTDETPLTFTNTYSVEDTTVSFPVKKVLEVPAGLTAPSIANAFTFKVTAKDGTPMPEVTEKKNPDATGGSVEFGAITYTEPGTYTYTVSETGEIDGVTNDADAAGKTVTVTVKDNGDGTLTAEADSTTASPLTFTNKYSVKPVEFDTTAMLKKTVAKMPPETSSVTFDFTLEAGANDAKADSEGETVATPVPVKDGKDNTAASATFTKAESQNLDFGKLTFTKPGTYNYTITEDVSKLDGGWTTTNNPAKVQIKVTDNSDGTLKAEVVEEKEITNTFETVVVSGTKSWHDDKYFVDGKEVKGYERPLVTIKLLADGAELDSKTVTAEDKWQYSFTDLPKYKEHGTPIVYTIEEVQPEGYTTPVVTDYNVENTPVPDVEVLNPTSFEILKIDSVTKGAIGTGAEFTLYKGEEAVDTYTTGDNGRVVVEFKQGGHEDGTYKLVETKAPTGYEASTAEFTIVVDKEFNIVRLKQDKSVWEWVYDLVKSSENAEYKDGVLTVPNTPILTKVKAEKVWNDNEDRDEIRPASIDLTLTGTAGEWSKTYDTVTVKADSEGNWSYEWTKLEGYHNGTKIDYTVEETPVEAYSTKYAYGEEPTKLEDGYKVTITNSHQSKPEKHAYIGTSTEKVDGEVVEPGQELTYKIKYVNTTGEKVETATITDKIPSNTTFVSADNGGTEADGTVTWTFTDVADGDVKEVTLVVKVKDSVSGEELINTSVVDDGTNKYTSNEVTNPTPPKKDVYTGTTTASIDGEVVKPGQVLTYSIKYSNSKDTAIKVDITDKYPELVEFQSADNGGKDANGTVTWKDIEIAAGDSVTVTFKVKVKETVSGEILTNDADVKNGGNTYTTNETSNPTPPKKEVYTGTTTTNIDGEEVKPGQELTYSIKYSNSEDEPIKVTITDKYPEYVEFVSADNDGKDADGTVTWTDIEVPAKGSVTVTFKVKVTEAQSGEELKNTSDVRNGKNTYTSNEVVNPVVNELIITKDLKNFVQHEGQDAKAAFAFRITGDSAKRGAYSNVVAVEFTGADTKEVKVTGIPSDIKNLNVEEIVSGNYTGTKSSITQAEDGRYKVTFTNKYSDTDHKTGTINNYKRNEDGTYSANGQGDNRSQKPTQTAEQPAEATQPDGSEN